MTTKGCDAGSPVGGALPLFRESCVMPPSFGTSGLRGLVVELTTAVVQDYTRAFIAACDTGGSVMVGWDLRPSSPAIAQAVLDSIHAVGLQAHSAGAVPTPALALAAMTKGCAAIMVTGSHIPADRNGLKFYTPDGEITKAHEAAILSALAGQAEPDFGAAPLAVAAMAAFVARYTDSFGPQALAGLRVGVYQHSSVARDMLTDVISSLGGTPVPLARSDHFVPVDTEAVAPETRAQLAEWCRAHALDALVSTDGDADRPLVTDATGQVVPGDVLGALTARALGARVICTPVTSNSMIDIMPDFADVIRTRIGSPYVIAAMEQVLKSDTRARVVGFEPNGGFLLGFAANGPNGPIAPLMTRDCILPILAPLTAAQAAGKTLRGLVAELPARFTAADRVQNVPTHASAILLRALTQDAAVRGDFFDSMGPEQDVDLTDGLRVLFESGDVVHVRPSGNAPECRCYAEADNPDRASELVARFMDKLKVALQ